MKKQPIEREQVQNVVDDVYKQGGLLSRLIAEIKKITIPIAVEITGKQRQCIKSLCTYKKPKVETILFYAKKLNVD